MRPGPPSVLTVVKKKNRLKRLSEGGKKHQNKTPTKPTSPLTHKTHHLRSLAKFLLQSYTRPSMAALKRSVCRAFREAGGLQMYTQETLGFIGSNTYIFISLEASWSFGNAVFDIFQ